MRRRALIVLLLLGTIGGFGYGFASKAAHYKGYDGSHCSKKQAADVAPDVAPEAAPVE